MRCLRASRPKRMPLVDVVDLAARQRDWYDLGLERPRFGRGGGAAMAFERVGVGSSRE